LKVGHFAVVLYCEVNLNTLPEVHCT
jgi:hypothetical protein